MEFTLNGNSLKTFARSITCLARIGNELVFQASPAQLCLHTLNSSKSAYQSTTFKPEFFDVYSVSGSRVQCSVLLKDMCAVLRTSVTRIDNLSFLFANSDASKVQWTLDCLNGLRKTYWITCIAEHNIHHLSLDRQKLPSNFVVRPQTLNKLLGNFQSTLQEITVIATQPSALPPDAADQIGGKAVEFRSYIDPTKENDASLQTQLWIDPAEEFVQYTHTGDPIDVTFGVKELKAFLSFCEGCEVDIGLYFDKAGEPILMAPKFGSDDVSFSNFDATLVLATMLASQLSGQPSGVAAEGALPQRRAKGNTSEHPSDHTRIWSDLPESAARDGSSTEQRATAERFDATDISADNNNAGCRHEYPIQDATCQGPSQRHPSNWVSVEDENDNEEDDDEDDTEMCVQSTPP
ncbi:uncharacterized protein LOC127258695 [Andrographis paniculata]|uniref:uncharacterized protein LOC127258695 n=1 Tax=Andrographis paniculata TaxID=175694 RepID=UPI0021E7F84B|nr:uncharacterized protein LOC127258695 [Andrographis paniculata]